MTTYDNQVARIAGQNREVGTVGHPLSHVGHQGDNKLFEMLSLEGAQAGLSWDTILRKREAPRRWDGPRVVAETAWGHNRGLTWRSPRMPPFFMPPSFHSVFTSLSTAFWHFLAVLVEFRIDIWGILGCIRWYCITCWPYHDDLVIL